MTYIMSFCFDNVGDVLTLHAEVLFVEGNSNLWVFDPDH